MPLKDVSRQMRSVLSVLTAADSELKLAKSNFEKHRELFVEMASYPFYQLAQKHPEMTTMLVEATVHDEHYECFFTQKHSNVGKVDSPKLIDMLGIKQFNEWFITVHEIGVNLNLLPDATKLKVIKFFNDIAVEHPGAIKVDSYSEPTESFHTERHTLPVVVNLKLDELVKPSREVTVK